MTGRSDVSGGLRALPVLAQDFAEPDVVPRPEREEVIAARADGAVAVLLERAAAGLVPDEHLGHELVQVQLAERVTGAKLHRLGRVALAPLLFHADHDPGRAVRV